MRTVWRVKLLDGCSFIESRPSKMSLPIEGELRVCGHPEHYPKLFPASYVQMIEVPETAAEIAELPEY